MEFEPWLFELLDPWSPESYFLSRFLVSFTMEAMRFPPLRPLELLVCLLLLEELQPPQGEDDEELLPQMIRQMAPRH